MYRFIISLIINLLLISAVFTQSDVIDKFYVPKDSLRQSDICSIMSIALAPVTNKYWTNRVDKHHSRRTMLYVLLSIKSLPDNKQLLNFIYECDPNFQWSTVEQNYHQLKNTIELYQKENEAEGLGDYWELNVKTSESKVLNSREYISRYRSNGFQPNELKIYWNYQEIYALTLCNQYNPITDADTVKGLLQSPVNKRQNAGIIKFIRAGIQEAVFDVPADKQAIVLDFADERMPGGYYIEGARTQEEVILYNSDGYRALLDLKYKMMDGGYMLPEYGLAYVKNVRFFQKSQNLERLTDLIVAACYDLSGQGEGLYQLPSLNDREDIRSRTKEKFLAIIGSAVANTDGNGSNTYLLLGPIGTGAFANDKEIIAELFSEILNSPLMDSTDPIRFCFDQIWFVSIDTLETFEAVFQRNVNH